MIYFLLFLIFLSKVSFSFLGIFPSQLSPLIFQYGLHPYMNMALNFLLGGLLILKWFWNARPPLYSQSRLYRLLLFLTALYLTLITLLQAAFVNTDESLILQMASAAMALFTIYLFGRVIPTSLAPEDFVTAIKKITVFLCVASLILLPIFPGSSFKGSRYIGLFKHIPHMVSCATLACFGLYYALFHQRLSRAQTLLHYLYLLVAVVSLILTGTRSAFAAVVLGYLLCLFVFKTDSWANRFLKTSLAVTALLVGLFFGHGLADYAVGVVRGEQAIGNRAAQDGLKSRLEEVERGYALFETHEWTGLGLLMKFSSGQEAEVTGYDANKDPHNILISAGVIGGWGFIVLVLVGFITLGFATFKTLASKNDALRVLGIYMLTHLPILFIYHVHLSVGGIADRIYWIVVGYMSLKELNVKADVNHG